MRPNPRRWWKPAALFAAAALLFRAQRQLSEVDHRRADRLEAGQAIDDLTERAAEEQLPEPTIWPLVLAFGVLFGLWGIILHTFFFGLGILIAIVALVGWMNLVAREKAQYIQTTPHEDPRST